VSGRFYLEDVLKGEGTSEETDRITGRVCKGLSLPFLFSPSPLSLRPVHKREREREFSLKTRIAYLGFEKL